MSEMGWNRTGNLMLEPTKTRRTVNGPKANVRQLYNWSSAGLPGSFSDFLGRTSDRIAGAHGQSGILGSAIEVGLRIA